MRKFFANFDWGLVLSLVILITLGLAIIKSVAPGLFPQQLIYSLLALMVFFFFSQIDYQVYSRLKNIFYFFSLLGLVLTFVFGAATRGSIRWVQLGPVGFQPSELVKPFLVLSLAAFLLSRPIENIRALLANLGFLAPPILLIFLQPDLGSSLVVLAFWLAMVLASGIKGRWVVGMGLLGFLTLPLGWLVLQPYQQTRITSFLSPFADPLGSGYNIIQSMVAIGSGQIFGRGLGRGPQSHLRFLPERHTDFIFASLSEELGLLGSLFLILLFAFLLWRLLKIASDSKDKFGFLVGIGVFGLFFVQFFVNVGMNLGLVPVTGITLPLVSHGGSSLLASTISLGIVHNISRFGKKKRF